MKKTVYLSLLVFLTCTNFPTSYQKIEDDKVRLIDYIYEPAEAAPGDTVTLRAVFSGKPVAAGDLTWTASWKVVKNIYDSDTAFDIKPLEYQLTPDYFSDRTSCISIKFVIPPDLLRQSPMIPDDWKAMLPPAIVNVLPNQVRSMNKSQLLDIVEALAAQVAVADQPMLELISGADKELVAILPSLLQYLTVPIRFFTKIKGAHTIRSDYSVRYNSRFQRLPGANVYVNNNPVIDSAGIFIINKKNLAVFDTSKNTHRFFRIYGPGDPGDSLTAIPVDPNCSYFIVAFTSRVDSETTIEGRLFKERHYAKWYFRLDSSETGGVSLDDLMDITETTSDLISSFVPPRNRKIGSFTAWVDVSDELMNVLFRPQGSAVKEVRGKFAYEN